MSNNKYCNTCRYYWCDGREIHCGKNLPMTPTFNGPTNCKGWEPKSNEKSMKEEVEEWINGAKYVDVWTDEYVDNNNHIKINIYLKDDKLWAIKWLNDIIVTRPYEVKAHEETVTVSEYV